MYVANKINAEKIQSATTDVDLSVHSCYSTVGVWKVNNSNKGDAHSKSKITQFKNQMEATKKIGAWCMVLHISKVLPEDATETLNILKPIAKRTGVKIGIEMVASKADREKTYETPEKIDNLITLLGKNEPWYGFVVDTAHIWGAGEDIQSYESMKNWLDRITFKKKICMFHLNGSSAVRGSGKDKHEIVFVKEDKIWHGIDPKKSGVRAVVEFAKKYDIPMICEINRGSEKEVNTGLEIIKQLA
jgi:endonuclease IV